MSTLIHDVDDTDDDVIETRKRGNAETRKCDARKETHHAGHKINVWSVCRAVPVHCWHSIPGWVPGALLE